MSRPLIALTMVAASFAAALPECVRAQTTKQTLPPIECPLRRAGIDPTKLNPFEEVEKYIQFLERPDRAQWQEPDEVVKALGQYFVASSDS